VGWDDENRPPGREKHRLDQISVQGQAIHRPRNDDNVVRSRRLSEAAIRIRVGLLDGLELDGYTRDGCGACYSLFGIFGMFAPLSIDLINEGMSDRNKSGEWNAKIWRSHENRKMGPLASTEGNRVIFGGTALFGRWGHFAETQGEANTFKLHEHPPVHLDRRAVASSLAPVFDFAQWRPLDSRKSASVN
jgi:hypothetical protein